MTVGLDVVPVENLILSICCILGEKMEHTAVRYFWNSEVSNSTMIFSVKDGNTS